MFGRILVQVDVRLHNHPKVKMSWRPVVRLGMMRCQSKLWRAQGAGTLKPSCQHLWTKAPCERRAARFFVSQWFNRPEARCEGHAKELVEIWDPQEVSQKEWEDLTTVGFETKSCDCVAKSSKDI